MLDFEQLGKDLLSTVIYFTVSLVLFGVAFKVMEALTPFSLRKELEEEHNTAVAILMGSGLIALAIVLAAVLRS